MTTDSPVLVLKPDRSISGLNEAAAEWFQDKPSAIKSTPLSTYVELQDEVDWPSLFSRLLPNATESVNLRLCRSSVENPRVTGELT
ncbi:MAG: hypothetical protein ABEK50_16760 [bacterium]